MSERVSLSASRAVSMVDAAGVCVIVRIGRRGLEAKLQLASSLFSAELTRDQSVQAKSMQLRRFFIC